MPPTDRSKPGSEGDPTKVQSEPPELSSRGKVVIRSSSHPPGTELPITDPPPDPGAADALRAKKDTPAERPRKRRKVQAERMAAEAAAREHAATAPSRAAAERERIEAEGKRENARLLWTLLALALIVAAVHYLAH